jgi:hypothetical protein
MSIRDETDRQAVADGAGRSGRNDRRKIRVGQLQKLREVRVKRVVVVLGLAVAGLNGLACTEEPSFGVGRVGAASAWCKDGVGCSGSKFERAEVPYEHFGPEHCGWQSETFIAFERGQYLQDGDNDLAGQSGIRYEADSSLPLDARYTGWQSGSRQLWLSDHDREESGMYLNIYVVTQDGIQRWPRLDLVCV